MKKIKLTLFFWMTMVSILFISCKPDVNLTSDYRDITVVYGLLNPLDSNHYIKIYKGYLTKDNALVLASDLDNISYYNDITVELVEHRKNGEVVTYPMDTVMSELKETGVFAHPVQVLYRPVKKLSNHTPVPIREGCMYELRITNKKTGRVDSSKTYTIDHMAFNVPMGSSESISTININYDVPWPVGFKSITWPENAYAVDAYVTFRYIEKNKNTGAIEHKSVDDIRVTTGFNLGNETVFKPNVILRILGEKIPVDDNVWRYPDTYQCIDIKLWACDSVYYKYYKTAQPSSTIVQDRMEYSNIRSSEGKALGFFASRTYYKRTFQLDIINHNEDSLARGQWTKKLNFRPYEELLNN